MIDFVKVELKGITPEELISNPALDFISQLNESTGELNQDIKTANIGALTITIKKNSYIEVTGSLHKHWNSLRIGEYINYNDFPFSDLYETVTRLCNTLKIHPNNAVLHGFEFGVNISTTFNPTHLIKDLIIDFQGWPPNDSQISSRKCSIEFEKSNYYFKIYDKGLQNNLPYNLLRLEIKVRKMEHVKQYGINSLGDLCDQEKLKKFDRLLIKAVDDLLICDCSNVVASMSIPERNVFSEGIYQKYWENLRPDPKEFPGGSRNKEYKRQKKKYYHRREYFRKTIRKCNLDKYQSLIRESVSDKWEELLCLGIKKGDNLTRYEIEKRGQSNTLNIMLNRPPKKSANNTPEYCYELECVEEVLDMFYGGLYTDHEVMSKYTIELLRRECNEKFELELKEKEFIDYARQLEPNLSSCPF